jgi:helicase
LANEKYEEFKPFENLVKPNGDLVKVMISSGDYDSRSEYLNEGDIIILTNEKFDSLLRHGIPWIDDVGLFVADEIHLVGDVYRGPTIETILTKILALAPNTQIISLSATIRNATELATWLKSKLIDNEWRPVKLLEGVYLHGQVFFSNKSEMKIDSTNRGLPIDVALDSVKQGGQSLIFTETRRRSVSLALKVSEVTSKNLTSFDKREANRIAKELRSIGEGTETSRKLARIIEQGAAFHHAGLDLRHRRLVEETFKKGIIKILTATPTLAAGVNLPARRVVLSSLFRYDSEFGGQTPISVLDYKQMCGRAGRPKFDDIGETVLIARSVEEADELYLRYIKGKPEPVRSQLVRNGALRKHLLATIATLPGITESEIHSIFSRTLLAHQYSISTVRTSISKALEFLFSEELVEHRGKRFLASKFGKRISMLYIDPTTGIEFKNAVEYTNKKSSYLTGFLQVITASLDFTPKLYLRRSDRELAEQFLEDHKEEFIIPLPEEGDFESFENVMQSFRIIMTLWSWINEESEEIIREKYGVESGDLHRSIESSDWLLYALGEVCKIIRKMNFLQEIDVLRKRIKYGIKPELLSLTTLEGVGRVRGRSLFNSGYTSLRKIKASPVERISRVEKIGLTVAKNIKKQLNS